MPILSILDLAPITEGSEAGAALRQAGDLAQAGERLGYHRYWMAEHHSMPGIASAATAVALAYVGSRTSTIRIGSGGNVLANSPHAIALAHMLLAIFFMFATTAFVANVVVRDDDTKFGPIVRSTRVTKVDYLIGRFTGATAAAAPVRPAT